MPEPSVAGASYSRRSNGNSDSPTGAEYRRSLRPIADPGPLRVDRCVLLNAAFVEPCRLSLLTSLPS